MSIARQPENNSPDVAILHDQFRTLGGAERVAVEMARALDAPIYAARVDDGILPSDVDAVELFNGLAGRAMHSHHHLQDLVQMYGWQHRPEVWDYDIILLNKTNPMWYVPRDHQTVLAYLHSTPRGFYDQFDVQGGGASTVLYTIMRTLFNGNRIRPDAMACNSELVQRRAELYWNRQHDLQTIYPPVPVNEFDPKSSETGEYYVSIGRLSRNKRVGEIVNAFLGSENTLKVAGDGNQRDKLEDMAQHSDNIEILGYVSEQKKRNLLSGAKATIMNAECEDFGITPIESMAAGTAVIGVDEGYTSEQISDGQTGVLYQRGRLKQAIGRFSRDGVIATESEIADSVDGFSSARFRREVVEWVLSSAGRTDIETDWPTSTHPQPVISDGGNDAT